MTRKLITCNSIEYRKGYIEVLGNIHDNSINLEVWNIHPDTDITNTHLDNLPTPNKAIVANTEIELSISEAQTLIEQLSKAIKSNIEKV